MNHADAATMSVTGIQEYIFLINVSARCGYALFFITTVRHPERPKTAFPELR